jgi:hypothetical protein
MTLNVSSTAEQLHGAAVLLAADDPDHAQFENYVGFSKADSWFGHYLVTVDPAEWTDEITADAYECLRRYREQLARKGINFDDIENPGLGRVHAPGAGRDQVTEGRKATKAAAVAAEKAAKIAADRSIVLSGSQICIRWNKRDPQFQSFYRAVKSAGARWNGAVWSLPVSSLNKVLIDALVGFDIPAEITALLADAPERPFVGTVKYQSNKLIINLTGRLGGSLFSEYRALDGYAWTRGTSESVADVTPRNIAWLQSNDFDLRAVPNLDEKIAQAQQAARKVEEAQADAKRAEKELHAASGAAETHASFDHLLPEGKSAYPFQTAGVEYALRVRRCLIADEMGLGKTIQALLTVEAADTFPVVVVCPASLKGNWVREINTWLPHRNVTVLSGRTANPNALKGFDFVVVNYDILSGWVDTLVAAGFEAIVLDESHYAKEPKSKRTKAALALAKSIPSDGIRLCLTGTPVLNRPKELLSQLQILDRVGDVVGPAKSPNGKFLYRYCGPESNRYGTTFNGATNLGELNERLRSTCYVRRERQDVLGLKNTRRQQITLSLNGALADYNRAEDDVIAYIRDELGTAAAIRAARAEIIVRLNTLRKLAEEAKIAAAIEWVEDWLESYPGKSIVVFAEHVVVQHALRDHFNCPTILAGEKNVEAQKATFESGKSRIIVCSLKAAREGHTLTAASDVVFTSLGWTPGGLAQAEDRCNRIGQEADQVWAWQLHAADTVDEEIGRLIEHKRSIVKKVTEGDDAEVDEDILDGVIDWLKGKN